MITDEQRIEILKRVQKIRQERYVQKIMDSNKWEKWYIIEEKDKPNLNKYKKIKEWTEE